MNLISLCNIKEMSCLAASQGAQDTLVNIAHKFNFMFPTQCIKADLFLTSNAYKLQMAKQDEAFSHMAHNSAFWDFIGHKSRMAFMPIHIEAQEVIRNGIPPEFRGKIWQTLAGINTTADSIGRYHELASIVIDKWEYEIQKDVRRTLDIHDPSFTKKLYRVLTAYANHNTAVGYCQSMNFIAASLLIFMPEEHAFHMLTYIIEELIPEFHSNTLQGYIESVQVFKFLIATELPELHSHFQRIRFDISSITSAWFLALYVHAMPMVTVFMVWDMLFLRGATAIFEVGIAILRMLEKELLQINDGYFMMAYIPEQMKKIYNPHKLLKYVKDLEQEKLHFAHEAIARMPKEVERAEKKIAKKFNGPGFTKYVLNNLWMQYVSRSPILCCEDTGLDISQFSQFISGTFSEWSVDSKLVERIFEIVDRNHDGQIDFSELASFLYVISNGTFNEYTKLTVAIFGSEGNKQMTKKDLANMLRTVYGMFSHDNSFANLIKHFSRNICSFPAIADNGFIARDNFADVIYAQKQIQQRFLTRNPQTKFSLHNTYFHWMNRFFTEEEKEEREGERKQKRDRKWREMEKDETIQIIFNLQHTFKRSNVVTNFSVFE